MAAATGARRGEVLAFRWSDVKGMVVLIDRSLRLTRDGLVFKSTKTEEPRRVELPPSMVACLDPHRLRQDKFRRQFGPDYRSDMDLIFANPDGTPLMPNSISSNGVAAVPALRAAQGSIAPRPATQPREPPAGRRRGPRDRLCAARPLIRVHDRRHLQPRDPRQGPRRRPILGRHHAASAQRDREIQDCKLMHCEVDRADRSRLHRINLCSVVWLPACVVSLIKQCVEGLKDKCFVLLFNRQVHHYHPPGRVYL